MPPIHVGVVHCWLYNVVWFGSCLSHDTYVQYITTHSPSVLSRNEFFGGEDGKGKVCLIPFSHGHVTGSNPGSTRFQSVSVHMAAIITNGKERIA